MIYIYIYIYIICILQISLECKLIFQTSILNLIPYFVIKTNEPYSIQIHLIENNYLRKFTKLLYLKNIKSNLKTYYLH